MDPQAVYPCRSEWALLRAHLKKVDLRALAELSGIAERRLRDYRQGARVPKRERVETIAEALAELLGG
jgi:transcriptional regulator with XRE-family HTH domain